MDPVQIRLADLPDALGLTGDDFIIIERPGIGVGTYKSTIRELQAATTVTAVVSQDQNVTTITVHDINGISEEKIVTPTARIDYIGGNELRITIQDTFGETTETFVKNIAQLDPEPIEDSSNFLTSGTIYTVQQDLKDDISHVDADLSDQIDNLNTTLTDKINNLDTAVNNRIDGVEDEIHQIDQGLSDRVHTLEEKVAALELLTQQLKAVTDIAYILEDNNTPPSA